MTQVRNMYMRDGFVIVDNYERSDKGYDRCIYCPGNEHLTKPAVLSLVQRGHIMHRMADSEDSYISDWCVRVVECNEPICTTNGSELSVNRSQYSMNRILYNEHAYGYHYILVASRKHCKPSALSVEEWVNVLTVLQDRIRWLYLHKGVAYVAVYMDYNASESWHPHLNILTLHRMPQLITKEIDTTNDYVENNSQCPLCSIMKESKSSRGLVDNDNFMVFCPWAPTHDYEFWIAPKEHLIHATKMTQREIEDLALMLKVSLSGLHSALGDIKFGLVLKTTSDKSKKPQIHWRIEVYPRVRDDSALKYGFGISLTLAPEKAAERLRTAMREEYARLIGVI